jgi:Fic family protein
MARAAARQRRSKALSGVEKPQSPAPTDPIEALFQTHADLSIGEVMDLTDQSRTTAHRRLVELVERGILERRGEGKASRYHRTR